jgi:FMN-dependent NADH-azoreductase
MTTLLRIDASARTQGSHSRDLAEVFQSRWLAAHPGGRVILRDLVADPVPHIHATTITGYYTPKEQHDASLRQATALSDTLIAELLAADALLLSTPMYNFSMPSALKAYVDQIMRIGHTFGYDPARGLYGMVADKPAYVITAAGLGYGPGPLHGYDFLTPYLRLVLNFLGITRVEFVSLEGTTLSELDRNKTQATERVAALAAA